MFFKKPSNNRNWSIDQKVLPYAKINNNLATVYNIRNFKYNSIDNYIPDYYNKTFDLHKIKSVDFVLEPFSKSPIAAHALLSFGFAGSEYVAISIEIRKKKREKFSVIRGFLNNYEIMYVIADEKDVIKLRSNYRKDKVYIYPLKIARNKIGALFLDIINRANKLKNEPEFYNTITNACATNIIKHINTIFPKRAPFSYKILFTGYLDEFIYDIGLINTNLSLEKAREKFLINKMAEKYANDPNFSILIRR